MYPKQKSYIPRFALLLNSFQSFFDDVTPANEITVESILKAEKISDYFVSNARKIKLESSETNTIKQAIKKAETSTEKIKAIYSQDPNFNRTKVAELLGLTRQQVIRLVKKLDENEKEAFLRLNSLSYQETDDELILGVLNRYQFSRNLHLP
jgi:L-lactate utilization protein LutC